MDVTPNVQVVRLFGQQPLHCRVAPVPDLTPGITQEAGGPFLGPRRVDAGPPAVGRPPLNPPGAGNRHSYVAGYVLAVAREVEGGPLNPLQTRPSPGDPLTLTACPFVKLKVFGTTPTSNPRGESPPDAPLGGPVWIDSDRMIQLPAARSQAVVMAPPDWIADPTPTAEVDAGVAWDVWVFVKICTCDCSWPTALPLLTEFSPDNVAFGQVPFPRPRAARAASFVPFVNEFWTLRVGTTDIGSLFVSGFNPKHVLPAMTELVPPLPVGTTQRTVIWDVQP